MRGLRGFFLKQKNWIIFLSLLLIFFLYLDKNIMLFLKYLKTNYPLQYSYLKNFTEIIETLYQIFVVIIIFLGLYNFFKNKKERGIKIILIVITVGILSQIKYLLGRARPKLTFDTLFTGPSKEYIYASFPSGHTFFIFAVARVFSHLYPRYKVFFYFFAILVALERLLAFAHFPSDIIAGAFLGNYLSKVIISEVSKRFET